MKYNHKYSLMIAVSALFALPAVSQETPESLLPPGFGDPPPAPPETPKPVDENINRPVKPRPDPIQARPRAERPKLNQAVEPVNEPKQQDEAEDDTPIAYVVPKAKQRSLGVVGVINQQQGGFDQSIFTGRDGEYMTRIAQNLKAPFLSRWATIMVRRLLMSKTAAPDNVDGADWVAERAWLLLRMGESVGARHLIQQVDARQYSNRLYKVAMPVFLANGDLAGFCPLADRASRVTEAASWKMSRVICLSLSGEQSRATAMLNRGKRDQWATGVDYLLAEKAIGAGTNGRRAVKIEWEDVKGFNAWRHGLSIATGVKPPERFYNISGRHVRSWLTLAPMVSINDRVFSAYAAAANGTLSNVAMVDLFSSADEDEDTSSETAEKVEWLNRAYTSSVEGRINSMRSLWESRDSAIARYSMKVLTARAAARVTPTDIEAENVDELVSSMMSAGLDIQASKWLKYTEIGSPAWAQIVMGSNLDDAMSASDIDSFYDQDQSFEAKKTAFLLAGLDGLGRLEDDEYVKASNAINSDNRKESKWSKALGKAVARKDKGAVVVIVAAGLQGNDWSKAPAFHLYHIVKALDAVGLNAEARMIAAEAIDRA